MKAKYSEDIVQTHVGFQKIWGLVVVCTWNDREFSDTDAFGFEASLSFRAGPEQTVTERLGSKGLASAGQGVRPRTSEAGILGGSKP